MKAEHLININANPCTSTGLTTAAVSNPVWYLDGTDYTSAFTLPAAVSFDVNSSSCD